jgi:hypothetical protein
LRQDGAGGAAASAIYPGSPAAIDLLTNTAGPFDGLNFGPATVDARVRRNAYLGNVGNDGDYFSHLVTLGPKGSIWAMSASFAIAPDAGKLDFSLASVASPNPNRAGVDDAGTLTDNALSYHLLTSADAYNAAFLDAELGGTSPFRITGDDGAPFTAFLGANDPYTGFRQIDGGAGVYAVRVKVNGKNVASAGFRARMTGLAFYRLDDNGFY